MQISDYSIRKPVTVIVGVLLIVLFGVIGLLSIPVQLTPDVEKPSISVRTYWPGASPIEVEREIVEKQEDRLRGIEDLVSMRSDSQDGRGNINLEFSIGTDINAAMLRVSNRLQRVRSYPSGAQRPELIPAGERGSAMAYSVIKALPGRLTPVGDDLEFIENYIKPRLERVKGIAAIDVFGGQEWEVQVVVDPEKLSARDVTVQELLKAISAGNKNTSAGGFDEGKRRYIVRTVGEYTSPEEIEKVMVKNINGQPIYVSDLARVSLNRKKPTFTVRNKGDKSIILRASRATGANILTAMAGFKAAIAELNEETLADKKMKIIQTSDQTTYIKSAMGLVKNNLMVGGSLAIIVLLIFLRSITSTLIIATAIPISVVGTFFMMSIFGRSLNVISLAGMAFAVGIVVDASIVVLENIYRHREQGESLKEAASKGTEEVWGAILASSLTTIAVFAPIIYMQDEVGQLFQDIAIAISSAVFLSMIVSITVIPMFASRILGAFRLGLGKKPETAGASEAAPNVKKSKLYAPARLFISLTTGLVHWITGRIWAQVMVVLILTSAALAMAAFLAPEAEYLPEGNRGMIFARIITPPGYNLSEFDKMADVIKEELSPYWEAKQGSPEAAALGVPLIRDMFFFARGQFSFMGIRPYAEDALRVKELIPLIRKTLGKLPGVRAIVWQPSLFSRGIGGGRSIEIEISGPELERIYALGSKILEQLRGLLPKAQIRAIPTLAFSNPEVRIIPDRVRLAELGLSATELGNMIDVFLDGKVISEYRYGGEKIDLIVMGEPTRLSRTQDLINLPVKTPGGQLITLGSVASIKTVSGPMQINHIERERAVTIQVIPPSTIPLQRVMEMIDTKVIQPIKKQGTLGNFYRIKLAGTADKLTQARKSLFYNFILALIITYLLMAALFENFVYPLVIMFSVPLAAAGGLLGLALVNRFLAFTSLDMLTMLGFVILIGIVVNNAILIVHQALNNIRYADMDYRLAVTESVRTRLRPIFMSMATSVFGMSPLVLFPGAGSELYRGLGGVVIGGLVISSVFTILLVPSLFTLVLRVQTRMGIKP